jgi:hypothetical protein
MYVFDFVQEYIKKNDFGVEYGLGCALVRSHSAPSLN